MVHARLHIICGNCGCNDMFMYNVKNELDDEYENKTITMVYIKCDNCGTIHVLEDNAKREVGK